MRKKAILLCMLFSVLTDAVAQTGPPETVWAVVAAGSTQNNFNISVDELSEGVKKYEQYVVNVDTLYNYDLIKRLTLTVWPTYEVYDTVMFHGDFPAGINEGANNLDLATVHSCDSVVHLYAMICPFTVIDGSNITYPTLVLDRYCWTQRNSQATVYDDGNATPVARALVYQSNRHPDVAANESVYGRLYTWWSAAGTLTPDKPALLGYSYYCDSPVPSTMIAGNAYSVRCVKNY